ncbi:MAG: hypothetical protein ABSG10_13400, partial [Terracidiphilus sp.]
SLAYGQEKTNIRLSGTAINTTKPDTPTAAQIEIKVGNGNCALKISPPLIGSGVCHVKSYDPKSGKLEIVSDGPPSIAWSGTIKGNVATGTYTIELGHQTGSFYLAVSNEIETKPPPPAPTVPAPAPQRSSCSPAIESTISGEIEGWDGETIFKLDNGQIWQQAEYDYTYFYEYRPDVTIYETSSGCRMKVEDEDDTVIVKRIK